jgi:two-component system invasion response regulator UvrY
MTPLINLLIAHSEPMFCDGFYNLFRKTSGISEVQTAFTPESANELLKQKQFHILFLDDTIAAAGTDQYAEILKNSIAELQIILITRSRDAEYIRKQRQAGIQALIHGSSTRKTLKTCLDSVIEGSSFIGPVISNIIAGEDIPVIKNEIDPETYFCLSKKEFEVFKLKAKRKTIDEIMEKMNWEKSTAKEYSAKVLNKVKQKGFMDVLDFVMKTGYKPVDDL